MKKNLMVLAFLIVFSFIIGWVIRETPQKNQSIMFASGNSNEKSQGSEPELNLSAPFANDKSVENNGNTKLSPVNENREIESNVTESELPKDEKTSVKDNQSSILSIVFNWEYKQFMTIGNQKMALIEIRNATNVVHVELSEGLNLENGLLVSSITDKAVTLKKGDDEYSLEFVEVPKAFNRKDIMEPLSEEDRKEMNEYIQKVYIEKMKALANESKNHKSGKDDFPVPMGTQGIKTADTNSQNSSGIVSGNDQQTKENAEDSMKKAIENVPSKEERYKIIETYILPTMHSVEDFENYWKGFHPGEDMPSVSLSNEIMADGTVQEKLVMNGN